MHMEKLSTSGPGHSPSIHHLPEEQESLNDCSMWDEDAMHQEWISHTDGNLESSLRFGSGYSSPGSIDDEILSFPSSPLGVSSRQSTVFRQDSLPPIDGRLGGYGSDRDDITSFSSEMTDNSTSYCRSRIEASPSLFMPSDNLSWDSWDTQDRLDMLRLPGDRSGLGKPLTRWIGDGKGDELAYFVSNDHLRCSADEDAQTDNASNWILQPYETSIERVSEVQKGRRFGEIPEDNALPLERIITPDIDVPISEADPPPNIVRQTPQPDELCSEEWSLDAVYERLFSAQEQSPEEQTQFILGPSLF
ncbi:hypothetical protein FRC17_000446 [Serendipita sp. 399]|nr:hypothetical protein FRC17_000446 [Serendipita sp. 399]